MATAHEIKDLDFLMALLKSMGLEYVLSVLATADDVKPNWTAVAQATNIQVNSSA
jgi:hypothetical protein